MKAEVDYKDCQSFDKLKEVIDEYLHDYNPKCINGT
ncbi:IS3 family transposase [Domibacillus aminovorans]